MIQPIEKKPEEITGKLLSYLREQLHDSAIDYARPLAQLKGDFETFMFSFKLKNVKEELNQRLVLRVFPESYGPDNAVWEGIIQNTLAGEGYPVPKVQFICTDKSILGGAFIIMDFLSGEPMMKASQNLPKLDK